MIKYFQKILHHINNVLEESLINNEVKKNNFDSTSHVPTNFKICNIIIFSYYF